MWLHVGVFGAKERFDAVDSQLLDTVDEFTATVVAPARVAFGVLVGQDRTLGLHHGQRCIVLRSDHLQAGFLTAQLAVDQGGDVRVEGGQGVVEGVHQLSPVCSAYSGAVKGVPGAIGCPAKWASGGRDIVSATARSPTVRSCGSDKGQLRFRRARIAPGWLRPPRSVLKPESLRRRIMAPLYTFGQARSVRPSLSPELPRRCGAWA